MNDLRDLSRDAARLQYIAECFRESARSGAPDRWSLEEQAVMLDGVAASLLTLGFATPAAADRYAVA